MARNVLQLVSGLVGNIGNSYRQWRVDENSPYAHFIGLTENPTAADTDDTWLIIRLTRTNGVMSIELAGGTATAKRVWANRTTYFSAPSSTPVDPATTQTSTVLKTTTASVAAGTSVLVTAANSSRIGIMIWNNSANSTYLSFESPASSSAPFAIVATFQTWVHPAGLIYTGPIYAIRNSGTGTWTAWELLQ